MRPASPRPHPPAELRGLAFAAPALLWTLAFFIAPFAAMLVVSLWERVGTDLVASWTLANYAKFFQRGAFLDAMVNSLEVTAVVTIASVSGSPIRPTDCNRRFTTPLLARTRSQE